MNAKLSPPREFPIGAYLTGRRIQRREIMASSAQALHSTDSPTLTAGPAVERLQERGAAGRLLDLMMHIGIFPFTTILALFGRGQ